MVLTDPAQTGRLHLCGQIGPALPRSDLGQLTEVRPERDLQRQPGGPTAGVTYRDGLHAVGVPEPLDRQRRVRIRIARHPDGADEPCLGSRGERPLEGQGLEAPEPQLHPREHPDSGAEEAVQAVTTQLPVRPGRCHRRSVHADDLGVGGQGLGPPRGLRALGAGGGTRRHLRGLRRLRWWRLRHLLGEGGWADGGLSDGA